jgi:hypothetical protein
MTDDPSNEGRETPSNDQPELSDLYAELDTLEGVVDSPEARHI